MTDFQPGLVVFSKSGRDKGRAFVVLSVDGEYLFLSDGDLRRLEKPKRKKQKHVQPTNYVSHTINEALSKGIALLDADVRRALLPYKK